MNSGPRLVRGPLRANFAGFTTNKSQRSSSMTLSAVLPIKTRFKADRDTAPMTTIALPVLRAVAGMAVAGSPRTR